jgi:Protein of unknown function (DUF2934)
MKSTTVPTMPATTPPEPIFEDAIRLRAYELYAQRGMAEGHSLHDWLAAEAELLDGRSTRPQPSSTEKKSRP